MTVAVASTEASSALVTGLKSIAKCCRVMKMTFRSLLLETIFGGSVMIKKEFLFLLEKWKLLTI